MANMRGVPGHQKEQNEKLDQTREQLYTCFPSLATLVAISLITIENSIGLNTHPCLRPEDSRTYR